MIFPLFFFEKFNQDETVSPGVEILPFPVLSRPGAR